jgi:plasmid stability protein
MHARTLGSVATLQVRNIPEDVRRILKDRAVAAGQSLSEYVSAELAKSARRPTLAELQARVNGRGRVGVPTRAVEHVRVEREARPG